MSVAVGAVALVSFGALVLAGWRLGAAWGEIRRLRVELRERERRLARIRSDAAP